MSSNSKRIAILTDSTCDLSHDIREKHNLFVVPQQVVWGEETLRDGIEIDADAFYRRLPIDPVHPRTSQPSVGEFIQMYERLAAEADEIVAVLVSNDLSGTITSAEGAKEQVDVPVHIVDSRSVSLGLGAIVVAAAEARAAGGDAQGIVAAAEQRAANTRIVFVVDTLEYLHKGGRIGGAAKFVGTALNLKPLLFIDEGRIEALERVRTRSKALARMLEIATDGLPQGVPLGGAILHAQAEEDAAEVAAQYKEMYQPREFMMAQVTPAIGVHSGPGIVGVVTYVI